MLISHVPVTDHLKEMDLLVKVGNLCTQSNIFHKCYATVPDPCNSEPCDTNAVCARDSPLNTNFTCTCNPPFQGDGFTCESK